MIKESGGQLYWSPLSFISILKSDYRKNIEFLEINKIAFGDGFMAECIIEPENTYFFLFVYS